MSKNSKFRKEMEDALKKRRKAMSIFMDVYYTKDSNVSNTDVHWQQIYEFVKKHSSEQEANVIKDNYELFAKIGSLLVSKQSELFVALFNDVKKDIDAIEAKYNKSKQNIKSA